LIATTIQTLNIMKVVEVIIDVSKSILINLQNSNTLQGFKSYAVRTVISGW
jgi:hypothetical protein